MSLGAACRCGACFIAELLFAVVLEPGDPNLIVCRGGHSISRGEYDYSKLVGYEPGLRGFDICTGCRIAQPDRQPPGDRA